MARAARCVAASFVLSPFAGTAARRRSACTSPAPRIVLVVRLRFLRLWLDRRRRCQARRGDRALARLRADAALLVYAALLGGALTLVILAVRRWPLPRVLRRVKWIDRLHDSQAGVPYGIALAAAGMLVYSDSTSRIFRHVSSA